MADIYCVGVNPISKTIAGSLTAGATTITIPNSTGLPTIPSGSFQTGRLTDPSTSPTENIRFTRSTTTLTLFASGTLANSYSAGATLDFDVISQSGLDQIKQDALSGSPRATVLTANGALTLGVMNPCAPTSAGITVTLADGTVDGQVVGISILDTATKLVTIDPAGTTKIDGFTTVIMWKDEFAWLAWDSGNTMWRKVSGRSLPMIASISLAANQTSLVNNVETLIAFDTSDLDNTGLMVTIGSSKMTIQRAGTYIALVTGCIGFTGIGVTSQNAQVLMYKGATRVLAAVSFMDAQSGNDLGKVKPLVFAAGDDVTGKYLQNSGGTTPLLLGAATNDTTYMSLVEVPAW